MYLTFLPAAVGVMTVIEYAGGVQSCPCIAMLLIGRPVQMLQSSFQGLSIFFLLLQIPFSTDFQFVQKHCLQSLVANKVTYTIDSPQ